MVIIKNLEIHGTPNGVPFFMFFSFKGLHTMFSHDITFMLYRNKNNGASKMKHDFSNEFNLNDPVDREVAIWKASTINSEIKDLKSELEWFKNNFRASLANGGEENGSHGSKVKVTKPNVETVHVDIEVIKQVFPVEQYPQYYKKVKGTNKILKTTRAQSVTFTLEK